MRKPGGDADIADEGGDDGGVPELGDGGNAGIMEKPCRGEFALSHGESASASR